MAKRATSANTPPANTTGFVGAVTERAAADNAIQDTLVALGNALLHTATLIPSLPLSDMTFSEVAAVFREWASTPPYDGDAQVLSNILTRFAQDQSADGHQGSERQLTVSPGTGAPLPAAKSAGATTPYTQATATQGGQVPVDRFWNLDTAEKKGAFLSALEHAPYVFTLAAYDMERKSAGGEEQARAAAAALVEIGKLFYQRGVPELAGKLTFMGWASPERARG